MRTVFLTTAGLLVVCFIGTILIATVGFAQVIEGNCASLYAGGAYGASACTGPGYCGPLVPGCCEYAPSCRCDNIWDGYCQEKHSGCGWSVFFLPRSLDIKRCFSRPCKTSSVCQPDGQPTCAGSGPRCAEPIYAAQPSAVPTGKPARPAPAIKPAPAKPAPPLPAPGKAAKKPDSKAKANTAWRFMPAGNTFVR